MARGERLKDVLPGFLIVEGRGDENVCPELGEAVNALRNLRQELGVENVDADGEAFHVAKPPRSRRWRSA